MVSTEKEKYIVEIERDSNTGLILKESWSDEDGRLNRKNGPAIQIFDPNTGKRVAAEYYWDDFPNPDANPDGSGRYIIHCDPKTDVVTLECWAEGNYIGRGEDLPGEIERDPTTGNIVKEIWYKNAFIHRDGDKPAIVETDPNSGVQTLTEYWKENNTFRDRMIGPAVIKRDAVSGEITAKEYYEGDLQLPPPDEEARQFDDLEP